MAEWMSLAALCWIALCAWLVGYVVGRAGRPIENKVVVDPRLAKGLSEQIVQLWLEQRGLTWMPKGVDYKAEKRRL